LWNFGVKDRINIRPLADARGYSKERKMEHVKYESAVMHENSPNCKVYEYVMKNAEMNIGVAEIAGRYPDEGYAMNNKCSEMGYILKGSGRLVTETDEATLGSGDVVYIPHGEKYYWEGNLTVALPCTPAWYPEQHETNLSTESLHKGSTRGCYSSFLK
jgi:mannose-6-phosphate isomerase-like protein (cupin superfamily)